jgi:phosphoribosylamine--glycine ligase
MANVLVIGSGAREHALVWKLKQSSSIDRIYCAPGNAGIKQIAQCIDYAPNDAQGIVEFCEHMFIDLVVVSLEEQLCNGLVDTLQENRIKAFGPSKAAAQLEGSKAYAKEFMKKYAIPTADFEIFDNATKAEAYVKAKGGSIVIKADGLAAGKGSIVCKTQEDAINAIDTIMFKKKFKDAGNKIVIEEFMPGTEASIMALCDGKTIKALISSQDHKQIYDDDNGPNTGGMGAYAPAPIVTDMVMKKVYDNILIPTIKGMAEEGMPFVGCLYPGLMIYNNEPKVVEFNVRFGDPETQVVLPLLENDLYSLLAACVEGTLHKHEIRNKEMAACCVVMASGGYPSTYEKDKEISGLDTVKQLPNIYVFHAGTKQKNGKYLTNGGRVLGVTGIDDTLEHAVYNAYVGVNKIRWEKEYHRKDIGNKRFTS